MLIGIMSDTHDHLPRVGRAIEYFNQKNVELVLHCGDLVSPFTAPCFKQLNSKLIIIWGNNDGDREALKREYAEVDADIRGSFAEVDVDGMKIAMVHGDEKELLNSLISSAAYDVVASGHDHTAKIEREGSTMTINPGEVCGYLTGRSTVAILDSRERQAEITTVE